MLRMGEGLENWDRRLLQRAKKIGEIFTCNTSTNTFNRLGVISWIGMISNSTARPICVSLHSSHPSGYYLLVQKALRSLPELQVIKLLQVVHDRDTHFITLISQCTFPSLRHFES